MISELSVRDRRGLCIALGGLAWVAFAIVAVLLRGVRLEESYEFAQVLLGRIRYPEGHPLALHVRNTFTMQTYVSALLMLLSPSPGWVCGVRNVLYVVAKTLPCYLLGVGLSRRIVTGHLAAILAFLCAQGFTCAYQSSAWPIISTNGVIGLGFPLAALGLLAMGALGSAYFMIGVMPAVHLGQTLPLFLVAGVHMVYLFIHDRRRLRARGLVRLLLKRVRLRSCPMITTIGSCGYRVPE